MAEKKSLRDIYPNRWDIPCFTLASAALLAAGLCLPVLTVRKLWEKNTFSIWTGIVAMWNEHDYFLAVVIFFFSIIFPIAKLFLLLYTWFARLNDDDRSQTLHFLGVLGKWSMLDVFVTAVMLVSLKLGALASADVEEGLFYFASSVLLAMAITSFQTRLAEGKG